MALHAHAHMHTRTQQACIHRIESGTNKQRGAKALGAAGQATRAHPMPRRSIWGVQRGTHTVKCQQPPKPPVRDKDCIGDGCQFKITAAQRREPKDLDIKARRTLFRINTRTHARTSCGLQPCGGRLQWRGWRLLQCGPQSACTEPKK
eukprot:scaffold182317_cov21-Tisochrysis_lutea.AAC.1